MAAAQAARTKAERRQALLSWQNMFDRVRLPMTQPARAAVEDAVEQAEGKGAAD